MSKTLDVSAIQVKQPWPTLSDPFPWETGSFGEPGLNLEQPELRPHDYNLVYPWADYFRDLCHHDRQLFALTTVYNIKQSNRNFASLSLQYFETVCKRFRRDLIGRDFNKPRYKDDWPIVVGFLDLPGKGRSSLQLNAVDISIHEQRLVHHHAMMAVKSQHVPKLNLMIDPLSSTINWTDKLLTRGAPICTSSKCGHLWRNVDPWLESPSGYQFKDPINGVVYPLIRYRAIPHGKGGYLWCLHHNTLVGTCRRYPFMRSIHVMPMDMEMLTNWIAYSTFHYFHTGELVDHMAIFPSSAT